MNFKRITFIIFLFASFLCLNAQDNLKVGGAISGGYTAISDPFLMGVRYRALINDSYPFHAGAYAEYTFKRLTIHSGINLGYERCNLLYKDIVGTDSILKNDPNANSLELLNNPLMIYDHINSFSVSIPLILKLKLISKFFVSAGLKGRYYFHSRVFHPFNGETSFGIGFQYPKLCFSISVDTPLRENGFEMINNNHIPDTEYQNNLVYTQRSVTFNISYLLWSK
ncbi:MAG: hypothetical protein K9H26_00375 [Prolixibacteraceae bacterium]|nr:hypothetical protein [Prolixibacteraceae bacterium]